MIPAACRRVRRVAGRASVCAVRTTCRRPLGAHFAVHLAAILAAAEVDTRLTFESGQGSVSVTPRG